MKIGNIQSTLLRRAVICVTMPFFAVAVVGAVVADLICTLFKGNVMEGLDNYLLELEDFINDVGADVVAAWSE